ncbi:MAG: dihydrolipoyl dehydrogenase [Candidatus Omnitrophica bacterium]|nr:dihydrolipoyl dehydrogenase [Candidatus Omnitrophota bacterium]
MYDLTVIGAGWAGFNACLKARSRGLKTCIIERSHVGGTCLNSGCIPTKVLIQSAKIYSLVKKSATFGIEVNSEAATNFAKIQERKDRIISQLRSGMQSRLLGIDCISAEASFVSPTEIKAGEQLIQTKHSLIATGSRSIEISALKFDGSKIVSSDDILKAKELPKSILIVGGGVIGCEFAGLFSGLGTQVTIVEKLPQILPGIDLEVVRKIGVVFKKIGIKVITGGDVSTQDLSGFDKVLVCVGRSSYSQGLGLENIGVVLERGNIAVDKYLRTTVGNIYAAGDCTGGIMLAHYAAYQGILAAENIAAGDSLRECSPSAVPSCIFTNPEIASVGINEDEANGRNLDVEVSKFDFLGSGMARILDEAEGFIKVIWDKKTQRILGGSIIGPRATELIAIIGLAVSSGLTVNNIRDTIFAHPTLSESIHDALDRDS